MTVPIFFVVERTLCGEQAALYHGEGPQERTTKPRIIYSIRLDKLPNSEFWTKKSPKELYEIYKKLHKNGTLPVQS